MYKIYCVQYDAGMCGTDVAQLMIGESVEQVCEDIYPEVEDWFWNFNDESDYGDLDDIEMNQEIDGAWAEEYDEEKHRGKLHESDAKIAELQAECDKLNNCPVAQR